MGIQYLNKELVLNKDKSYVTDRMFFDDIKYCIRKYCCFEKINKKVEKRLYFNYGNEIDNFKKYYIDNFKNNYNKSILKNHYKVDIQNNWDAYTYLENTFPYCLFENGDVDTKDLDSALLFFAKYNLGAKEEQLEDIIPMLKFMSSRKLEDSNLNNYKEDYCFLRYGDIYGTLNPKYQKKSLYDMLHALDDCDLKKYINYVMVMDGLQKPKNILRYDPVLCVKDNDMLYVVNGNHRLILCKILYEITRLVTLNGFNNDKLFYGKVLIKK